jgi:hypothetical protein
LRPQPARRRLVWSRGGTSMSRATTLIGLAVLLLAVGGCSKAASEPDTQAWKADLAAIGVHPHPWQDYVDVVNAQLCDGDYVYVVSLQGHLAADRIGIKYACPEHLGEWDDAVANYPNRSASRP